MLSGVLGIDNGTSGSIGIVAPDGCGFTPTPTKKENSYTKTKKVITRIDVKKLKQLLFDWQIIESVGTILIERPMVNPGRFAQTQSSMRSLEATLIVLEQLLLGSIIVYVDSKEWQRELLPGVKGSENLKRASMELGCKLFPKRAADIQKHGDADSLLMAHWYYKKSKKNKVA